MREVITTGKTVEEATENGCAELGLSRAEVSVEILDMPVRKLFKTLPAKVKVKPLFEDEEEQQATPAAQPAEKAKPETKTEAQPQKAEKPQQAPKAVLPVEPEEDIDIEANPPVKAAVAYLNEIFAAMGAGVVQITAVKQGDATLLRAEGETLGDVLETRGDTIQALSYLTDRAVNKGVDKKDDAYLRIRLDIAGYRGRRENELISLATRTGKEVRSTKRSRTLAPMNPYERLIIHTTISGMDGLVSESIGADAERRVVVKSTAPDATDGEDWRPPRRGPGGGRNNNRGGNGGRGGRGRDNRDSRGGSKPRSPRREGGGERRTSTPEREYADKKRDPNAAPVVPQRREVVRDGEDLPLYGKIEL